MAEIAVQFLLERLTSLIVEEGKLLGGIGRDVDDIKDDLETMRAFLQDADSRGETDQGIKTWVKQVRDVAYDIEDVLDEFLLCVVRPYKHGGIFNSIVNKLHYISYLTTRHRLAAEIQNIRARLKAISTRRQAFSFTDSGAGMISRADIKRNAWYDPRISSLQINESEVVGIEVSKNTLIRCLTEGELKLTIISVVGMGGLGKTTLVKKVYDCQMVNKYFECHVWITVSNSPMIGEILRTAIKEVRKVTKEQAPEGMEAMNDNELIEMLKNSLWEKRYVVIFDDIWDIYVWEAIRFAFPNCDCGSRIIFTTRITEVATCSSSSYVHELEPLKVQEAWRLFCMKAFGSNHDSSRCPEELEELSQNILKKCSGLPLAIVLVGGLLARKAKTVWEWKNVYDSLGAEMRIGHHLESLSRILLLSYNNLPSYIKPCFLYLSMFPEDYFIKPNMMIRLWIAEGFVEEKQGVTMEVVARDYINELISRSMIQVAELSYHCNELKSCKIHDLVREIILSKAKEECFCTTVFGSQGIVYLNDKARRISVYPNTGENNYNYTYSMASRSPNIRSLMVFQLVGSPQSFEGKFFRAFKFLRVLDLEGADLVEFPAELVDFIYLRYLSLKRTKITVVPKSVGKLINLQTLNLKYTNVSKLPVEILKLQYLRHLILCRGDFSYHNLTYDVDGVSVPAAGIGKLTCLEDLRYLDVQQYQAIGLMELGKLTRLRRLAITNLRSEDGSALCHALEKMEHLTSLRLGSVNSSKFVFRFLQLDSLMSAPLFLNHLYLRGRLMKLPRWIGSLRNLTVLGLRYSRLPCEEENDPLKAFQHMPNLVYLDLLEAYNGDEVCCSEVGGYKKLKKLYLWKMERLKRVRFVEGSMEILEELHIWRCPVLEMVPFGIEHLSGLQMLSLFAVNDGLVKRIRKIPAAAKQDGETQGEGEDWWRIQHIPTIQLNGLDQ